MATCKDCIHHDLCDAKGNLILTINDVCELEYRTDVSKWWCKHFKPTADVVPKSEEGAECPTCHGTGRIGTKEQLAKEKAKAIAEHEQNIKQDYAREIFEEIERLIKICRLLVGCGFKQDVAELKKKYTEEKKDV